MTRRYLIILDVEATCDKVETEAIRGANREMIELGAVKMDISTGREVESFQSFVRPVHNPVLTPYCSELLGISQEDVDSAPLFKEVSKEFLSWCGDDVAAWASWGNFDSFQWTHDSNRYGLAPDLPWAHLNLKKLFGKAMGMKRRGIGGAFAEMGLEMGPDRHRALADARQILTLLQQTPAFMAHVRGEIPHHT